MSKNVPITVAYGDGIGPEIMDAVLHILKKAGANISVETIDIGKKMYERKYSSGIAPESWQSVQDTGILLKAPITTPQGGGYKSLNVTLRKTLGLYANIRPSISYHPFVQTMHPELDVVIVRENEEDLYAGIEYRHTHNMQESIKLISRTGCEKIVRYAFEYAKNNGRKKVTCFSKDNIMKFSDGILHKVFDEIATEYKEIENEHYIVDIGTARLANSPQDFDVIVTSNLFGDIISDITAEISGSVGLAGSANIGSNYAMFEAIHGSAPDIAGKGIANPSGLLNGAIMMLVHIGQSDVASNIENAWKKTLEDGIHTADIYNPENSVRKVSTSEFASEVIARLGKKPAKLKQANYPEKIDNKQQFNFAIIKEEVKTLVGVDIFVDIHAKSANEVADKLNSLQNNTVLTLEVISSKGLKLWPLDNEYPTESDHWCCRFKPREGSSMSHQDIGNLLNIIAEADIDFIKVENLYEYDGKRGYSLAQGE